MLIVFGILVPLFLYFFLRLPHFIKRTKKKKSNFLSIRNPRLISLFFVCEKMTVHQYRFEYFHLFFLIFHAGMTFYESRSNLPIFLKVAEMGSLGRHSRHQVAYSIQKNCSQGSYNSRVH